MRDLTLGEVVELHRLVVGATGGAPGVRDLAGGLESAIAQPKATFGGADLYPMIVEKAAALCFTITRNAPCWTWLPAHGAAMRWSSGFGRA
jgi:death-on-curing protein